ncbi:hypothetical protein K431DRAFT_250825 [Polychaeton citri CBS 116435]|uniref:J domain-containing protein n=1 Tax=Polychaeton citri CBS 116435 TaxID=1314669 RepID=A0A9P4Q4N1_9PEZI|nr:hypothetical protein K431DRAFT_250825 [Polychaeton citri CBS 116435]
MSNEYNYDDQAQFYPFFVLTVSSLITLPLTYNLLQKPSDALLSGKKQEKIASGFTPQNASLIETQRAKQKRKELRLKRMVTAGVGWVVIVYMIYLMIVMQQAAPTIWNPYEILDIGMSATEKQINSRYRRLSVTMHPDKRQPNSALNETMDSVNDEWVEIVKAYKALTDEEVRNNYIQYGNPDGKQSTSFGIALPQFLVAEGSGKYVLIFYGALLGIGLPLLVGKWWYGMQKVTREKVLVTSAGDMFKEYRERMDEGDMLSALSLGGEFRTILNGPKAQSGLATVEKALNALDPSIMPPKFLKTIENLDDDSRRKTLALLWAYATRRDLSNNKALEGEKYELAPTALQLNEAFFSTCLAFGFTAPLLASFRLSQALTQALPPTSAASSPLLQLPHFSPDIARSIEEASQTTTRSHLTIQKFMALPSEQRQALAQAAGLTHDRLKQSEHVARQLPYLQIEKAWFKVQGEKYIIPSSLVQLVIKARFVPPGFTAAAIPALKESDLEDVDPAEGDLKAQKIEPEQHPLPLTYAPYLPRDRATRYHTFLADTRQGRIAVPPFAFQNFDKAAFREAKDGKGVEPTFQVVTLKMQFQAPPQPGEYKFRMHLICDSYAGFDEYRDISLVIDDASKVQAVDDDDEISEPEEDTIAGQMAALAGKPTADPNKPRKARTVPDDEDSDYESGTDEDEESESETDTETDTDGE